MRSGVVLALALAAATPAAAADGCAIDAKSGSVAICGSANGATVNINTPPDKIDELVRLRAQPLEDLTAAQKQLIAKLQADLDLNGRQIHAALEILGEAEVPPEKLAAHLVEIAQRYKALRDNAATQPGDDAATEALKRDAQAAIEAGELAKADGLLAQVEATQKAVLARLAANAAATAGKRGEIAMTRLRYIEAAEHFADAAAALSADGAHDADRVDYLWREADARYRQGREFGDNGALAAAISRWSRLLDLRLRTSAPQDWAALQNNLGIALESLGERDSGTGRLDEAVAAYRAALQERTRERGPLDWARIQNNLGNALKALGERESGTGRLEEAVAAYRAALQVRTRERAPLDWAMTQNNRAMCWRGSASARAGPGGSTKPWPPIAPRCRSSPVSARRWTGRRRRTISARR